ncbi:hypothetical protein EJ04DRAFT_77749 [Polyplosphaeria fusca]|uniref:endo-1,3(4)-beta-glucanase n=1 Tax=Polyplosphaeria fusca TaxID=682080 RepID=A0A9P4QM93_9PLEO|nr:hypothetical protein EJ04DRAFT_77749 [Polyplosphaeria fusca]
MHFSTLLSGAALANLAIAGYVLEDDYMNDFFGNFDFFTAPDPTNGFVDYVDQSTAQSTGLINATSGGISWGVDSTNQTPNGRPSVRISSKKSYDSGLVVLDVAHMPTGCGTWPAFWMVGPDWPDNGEIDILEGVNDQETNAMTLHTGPNCAITGNGAQGGFSGDVATENCDVNAPDQDKNAGCSIKHPSKQSYGAGLNDIQGGVYATQWTEDAISVFFFPRDSIPKDIASGSPDPSTWGLPSAKFSGSCDIASTFKQQQIVFDTTFCGDWAGNAWDSSSCSSKAKTCDEYVQNNPEAFGEAYWTINSLKVYQDNGGESPAPPSSVAPSSSLVISTAVSTIESAPPSGLPTSDLPGVPSISISIPIPAPSGSSLVPPGIPTDGFGHHSRSRHGYGRPSQSASFNDQLLPTATGAVPGASGTAPPGELVSTSAPPFPTANATAPIFSLSTAPSAQTSSSSSAAPIVAPSAAPSDGPDDTNSPMDGFAWPKANGAPANPSNPGPGANNSAPAAPPSSTVPAISSTVLSGPAAPSVPAAPSDVAPAAPSAPVSSDAPKRVAHTVYETVVITVPAAAPTPAGRKARHERQHRRRLTQHHAHR